MAIVLGGGFLVTLIVAAKLIDNITAASLAFSRPLRERTVTTLA